MNANNEQHIGLKNFETLMQKLYLYYQKLITSSSNLITMICRHALINVNQTPSSQKTRSWSMSVKIRRQFIVIDIPYSGHQCVSIMRSQAMLFSFEPFRCSLNIREPVNFPNHRQSFFTYTPVPWSATVITSYMLRFLERDINSVVLTRRVGLQAIQVNPTSSR